MVLVETRIFICFFFVSYGFFFFKILQENISLAKSHEGKFKDKLKPILEQKTYVARPAKKAVLNITSASNPIPRECQKVKQNVKLCTKTSKKRKAKIIQGNSI